MTMLDQIREINTQWISGLCTAEEAMNQIAYLFAKEGLL
jgi:hypothetical protein